MEELKNFELSNKILDNFDKVMNYHLDTVEELTIKEFFSNSKLYNIISLCTNLKTLVIEGDARIDVNKIMFSIFKPELLETLILNSVKLPTTKSFDKFTNIQTISLTNITFSNVSSFFDRIPNKEKIIALNLSNVDLARKSISICSAFPNLKYLNIDGLKNCKFDDFSFLSESNKISRLDFFGNEVEFEAVKELTKKNYTKNIDVKIKTSKNSGVDNRFEINGEDEMILTINSSDFEKNIYYLIFSKLQNLYLVIDNNINITQYIKKLKRVKGKVIINVKDISYLDIETVKDLQDRLNLENIGVLDYGMSKVKIYSIEDYIQIREKFDEIVSKISKHSNEIEMFEELYNYLKNNIEYTEDDECDIKTFFLENKSNYNLYASVLDSILRVLKIKSKIISGISFDEQETHIWNQVKLNKDWYNTDLAGDLKQKTNKKIWKLSSKEILFDDETFYKNHIVQNGKVEICNTQFEQKKKELKNSVKKTGKFKRIVSKLKSIFSFNKNKSLPEPENVKVSESKNKD